MPIIYVDADACPVKNEVYRVAEREGLDVVLVANSAMRVPEKAWVSLVVVGKRWDEADDWIVEKAGDQDVVVTSDILLAERCIRQKGAHPITPHGKALTGHNIGEAIAQRELMERLRQWGSEQHGGPPPFTARHRSFFLQTLHQVLAAIQSGKSRHG